MLAPVLRFAPSPNGPLHLGHALSALLNAEAARRVGGRFLLRIEDHDRVRSTEANVRGVLLDLRWLGLAWEGPPRRQTEHLDAYRAALDDLAVQGLAYRCFASRGEIAAAVAGRPGWPRDPDGAPVYPGLWRGAPEDAVAAALGAGRPFAWRLDMARAIAAANAARLGWTETGLGRAERMPARPERWGDVVLVRRDAPASYHLAVVVDDAAQGVSHVVRGRDLQEATAVHRLLQRLLGLPEPRYHHHRLILGPDGRKLSKSLGSAGLAALRAEGADPAEVLRRIGWDPDGDLAGLS